MRKEDCAVVLHGLFGIREEGMSFFDLVLETCSCTLLNDDVFLLKLLVYGFGFCVEVVASSFKDRLVKGFFGVGRRFVYCEVCLVCLNKQKHKTGISPYLDRTIHADYLKSVMVSVFFLVLLVHFIIAFYAIIFYFQINNKIFF